MSPPEENLQLSLNISHEENFEDYLLENNPKFLAALEKAREEYLELGGINIDEYLKKRKSKHE